MIDPIAVLYLIGGLTLTAAGLLLLVPVNECPRCPHCKTERQRRDEEQARLNARYCQKCGTSHDEGKHDR